MRLLKLGDHGELSLTNDLVDVVEPYAILSHTWGTDEEEVTFQDLKNGLGRDKIGYHKIEFCATQTRQDGIRYFWVDTCSIDKANHVQLSEAITSMFRWYRSAVKCYVYLSDVEVGEYEDHNSVQTAFRDSRWFKRGWTLQELLAPQSVEFFSREGVFLGDKRTLELQIHEITNIPIDALRGCPLSQFSVSERMRWAANRETKKREDKAYCLLGIFDVSMSLRYGEGDKAFERLQKKIYGSSRGRDGPFLFANHSDAEEGSDQELIAWLAPARAEESQARTSASRHPDTGSSFATGPLRSWLQDEHGRNSLMWITGKSGSGKTTLFSYAVEKAQAFASEVPTMLFAFHYCKFSDSDSRGLVNILGSLVVQISASHPGILDELKETFEMDKARQRGKTLRISKLERVLVQHVARFDIAVILLDALDESEDFVESVACVMRLLQQLPNLKILATSTRNAAGADIGKWPSLFEFSMRPDEDISTYVEATLSAHAVLRHLSSESRRKVKSVLTSKADHSFRWVHLTLENLCRQRTGRAVMNTLTHVPEGLNELYASMLDRIPVPDRTIAREVLLWLSFAVRPMTLVELSEAAILDESDTTLTQDSRLPNPKVVLEICHGFLEYDAATGKVKLAHASVREYLLSDSLRREGDSFFSFNADEGKRSLMRKCLTYLMFNDFESRPFPCVDDKFLRMLDFPLLDYAAHCWGMHASLATESEWHLVDRFFSTRTLGERGSYHAWVTYLNPHWDLHVVMHTTPLYVAASCGLTSVVRYLLSHPRSFELEQPGGRFGSTALQAACYRSQREVAGVLVAAGADFWTKDPGSSKPAWFWAQSNGWKDLVDHMGKLRPEIAGQTSLSDKQIRWANRSRRTVG